MTPTRSATLFGHPPGLYALFFAEMWERFSYYGMRALLVFYMLKGFLGYGDTEAYRVYGAYTALVYMTPFVGGMIADRLLGARRAVVLGGLLMAGGHLLMGMDPTLLGDSADASTRHELGVLAFYTALALLIVGNGFFKPNISTMVGSLYPQGDPRRDGGFTIFYIGINLGAAMAPLLCGYVGERFGWHLGFGLATVGMLVGLAVFVIPSAIARVLILASAVITAVSMVGLQDNALLLVVNGFVAVMLVLAGLSAYVALGREGLPAHLGEAPDPTRLSAPVLGIPTQFAVPVATLLTVPVLVGLVWSSRFVQLIPDAALARLHDSPWTLMNLAGTLLGEVSTPAGLILVATGLIAFGYILVQALRFSTDTERDRLLVILVMLFFSMLFWSFFEQAGSSINNFTDRNVDRVFETRTLTEADVGTTVPLTMTQEQLGYTNGAALITMDVLDEAREDQALAVDWPVSADDVGMGLSDTEIPASTFQSANPVFILLFGVPLSLLWTWLGQRGREPSTPVKFGLGLLQLGLGFLALYIGARLHDPRGMVAMTWLLLGYALQTTGELSLSPVGLSMITKLSPARLVSTLMGAWFLATAFSSFLAAIIAAFTGVDHSAGAGSGGTIPPPIETVGVYGDVFGTIGIAALVAAAILFALSPWLTAGMHTATLEEPAP